MPALVTVCVVVKSPRKRSNLNVKCLASPFAVRFVIFFVPGAGGTVLNFSHQSQPQINHVGRLVGCSLYFCSQLTYRYHVKATATVPRCSQLHLPVCFLARRRRRHRTAMFKNHPGHKMAQSCGGDAVSMQGAVVKALVRLVMERPVIVFAAKSGTYSV